MPRVGVRTLAPSILGMRVIRGINALRHIEFSKKNTTKIIEDLLDDWPTILQKFIIEPIWTTRYVIW
jgi:hypothetical protein